MNRAKPRKSGFVLLEVTLAIVILAVVMTALLRGFLIAMYSVKRIEVTAVATQLAESLMEDYELEPPVRGRADGEFADDQRFGEEFANFQWRREVEIVEAEYDDIPRNPLREPEPLYKMNLQIWYDDGRNDPFLPIQINTYLMRPEIFSRQATLSNQLF